MIMEKIAEFLDLFYGQAIKELSFDYPARRSLEVDYADLERFDLELADALLKNPEEFLARADRILSQKIVPPEPTPVEAHFRPVNLSIIEKRIQDITNQDINRLVFIKGVITKRGQVLYRLRRGFFECTREGCGYTTIYTYDRNTKPPRICLQCKAPLRLNEEKSEFLDIQRAEIQELLERVKGSTPSRIELLLEDDLVNQITPGDIVEIAGILRTRQGKNQIFEKYIQVVSVKKTQKEFEELAIDEEDERRILKLGEDPLVLDKIASAISPGIFGHYEVKKALALQLFGGTRDKKMPEGSNIRSNIHILLIGDPGVAKTRFLLSVVDLAPKSVYVSGKSASGVGLTASAEKDELSEGGWTLKAGALVLASGGIAAIDEFDKIDDKERAALHEAMESGTISVAKAGIVARLKADTSVLAAANPKFGRFDPSRSIVDQFNVPPSLLSRFDLIFPLMDIGDERSDRQLAEHIVDIHRGAKEIDTIDRELLRKYVAYARKHFQPVLSQKAAKRISSYYVHLRKIGRQQGTIAITPRQIEGIIRLAEAAAKARLKNVVEETEVEEAIALFEFMLKSIAADKGTLDIDAITLGKPKRERDKMARVLDIIKAHPEGLPVKELKELLANEGYEPYEVDKYIKELQKMGEIYMPKFGEVRPVMTEE